MKAGREKRSLVFEADEFLSLVTEKLFALALILHMPAILERQALKIA